MEEMGMGKKEEKKMGKTIDPTTSKNTELLTRCGKGKEQERD